MDKHSTIKLSTQNEMPVLGLGTWQLTKDTAGTVAYALELGYRLIDTSSDYRTQPGIGEGIKKSGIDRDELYITTKVEETDDSYARTRSNLRELGLDYVDLMLIHRPPYRGAGEELWEGLIAAKKEGLVRDIGVSNYSIPLMDQLIETSGETPAVNQIEWSPFGHAFEMVDYCAAKGIVIQAYSPLTRTRRLGDKMLQQIAENYGKSPAQILIRWNLQLGTVPIPKANRKEHLEEDFDVFNFEIDHDDMAALSGLNEHYSSLGSLPYLIDIRKFINRGKRAA
jgi:2,5-diketo-D-gluconate reductase A